MVCLSHDNATHTAASLQLAVPQPSGRLLPTHADLRARGDTRGNDVRSTLRHPRQHQR